MSSEVKLLKAQRLSDRRNIEFSIYGKHITPPMETNAWMERK